MEKKILSNIKVVVTRQVKGKTARFRLPSVAQKHRVLKLPNYLSHSASIGQKSYLNDGAFLLTWYVEIQITRKVDIIRMIRHFQKYHNTLCFCGFQLSVESR